jgi:hypothetical protein
MGMFVLYLYGFWMLRRLFTEKLRLKSLKQLLNLQLVGWSLLLLPVGFDVLLAKVKPVWEFVIHDHVRLWQISYYATSIIDSIGIGLIGIGVLASGRFNGKMSVGNRR